jgi:hypothetical protein
VSFFWGNWETKKDAYSCASENMDMVKMSEDVDDEFWRKVLDGGMHIIRGVEYLGPEDEIRVRMLAEIDN